MAGAATNKKPPELEEGDQLQIFRGPYDPDDGSERAVMAIWSSAGKLRWWGPPDPELLARGVVREVEVRVPIELISNFKVKRPE